MRLEETYKLFNAMQSFSGTRPYQQFPPQLAWSHKRTPPMLRLVTGLAVVVVIVVAARRTSVMSVWNGEESIAASDGAMETLVTSLIGCERPVV